jgi:hypothetical protein
MVARIAATDRCSRQRILLSFNAESKLERDNCGGASNGMTTGTCLIKPSIRPFNVEPGHIPPRGRHAPPPSKGAVASVTEMEMLHTVHSDLGTLCHNLDVRPPGARGGSGCSAENVNLQPNFGLTSSMFEV